MQMHRIEALPVAAPIMLMSVQGQREAIHDLRNLFGVVASATHLLEPHVISRSDISLLEAIEDAALKGGALTTRLLAPPCRAGVRHVDINRQVLDLAPLLHAAAGRTGVLHLDLCERSLRVRANGDDFDATLLELVANARAAGAKSIVIRTRRVGARCWLTVADTGTGMSSPQCETARTGTDRGDAHGTGLSRVHHFAEAAHGRLHVRSRQGRGTTISISLPTVLSLAGREVVSTHAGRR